MDTGFLIANRRIDPARTARVRTKPDGSPDDKDRVEIGPTDRAFAEWADLGLTPPNLARMRQDRLDRVVGEINRRGYAGVLCFDPLNIRYAADSSKMHLWIARNPARAVFVGADGYVVLWDFHGCGHLSGYLPLINEVRSGGVGFFYFLAGDQEDAVARRFAGEIDDLLREHGNGRRLAVDRIELCGVRALDAAGVEIENGMQLMEHARLVKSPDEIKAMRCAIATCEIAVAEMRTALRPGIAETELWSILHAENIARGGEWIETRILSSGPRTDPWMQEAGPRCVEAGELLGFDTDLIGPYGMCADISRTWFCGDGRPSDAQRRLHDVAHTHIMTNMELLKPGVTFKELAFGGHVLPDAFVAQRYGVKMHGVGLCDEFPAIYYPEDFIDGAFDYTVEAGMAFCVEVYIGEVGGHEGVKLENQVLVTETGFENLTRCPFDEKLMG